MPVRRTASRRDRSAKRIRLRSQSPQIEQWVLDPMLERDKGSQQEQAQDHQTERADVRDSPVVGSLAGKHDGRQSRRQEQDPPQVE